MRTTARLKRYLIARYRTLMASGGSAAAAPGTFAPATSILNSYFRSAPTPQNALDIFKGEWASRLPAPYADLEAGSIPLFADGRVSQFLGEIGGVAGKAVLELGPLEGGHAYMLDRAGAARVLSIEGNSRAYLKCLIVKELLGLANVRFQCGDFVAYLRDTEEHFDVCVASGVLYHMQNPAELVALLAKRCAGHVYFWTHYYDAALIARHSKSSHKYPGGHQSVHLGFEHTLHVHEYQRALDQQSFCGGSAPTSCWMTKDDILRGLEFFGFSDVRVLGDQPDHPNGPAFEVMAGRRPGY